MSAALRQSYLRAMGLPLYVPRFILPGAAPSPAVEIDQPDVNSPAPQPSLEKTLPKGDCCDSALKLQILGKNSLRIGPIDVLEGS